MAITNFYQKELYSFQGLAIYDRHFISNFTVAEKCLHHLERVTHTKKDKNTKAVPKQG